MKSSQHDDSIFGSWTCRWRNMSSEKKEVRMQSYVTLGLLLELLHHGVHHQLLYVNQMIVTD